MNGEHAITPTRKDRARSMDVLRGVAILGILLANIWAFADPVLMTEFLGVSAAGHGVPEPLEGWLAFLVSGKFRSLLCLLFGAGLCLHLTKRLRENQPLSSAYRRYGLLALFGFVHGTFIWFGDILFAYGVTALLVISLLGGTSRERLPSVIKGLAAVAVLLGIVVSLSGASAATGLPADSLASLNPYIGTQAEIAAYQQGGYGIQLVYRMSLFLMSALSIIFLVPVLGCLFLIGFWLADQGAFTRPHDHQLLWRKIRAFGLGVGIPLNAIALVPMPDPVFLTYSMFIEMTAAPILSIGILATVMLLCCQGVPAVFKPFENVGKLALTNYLLQSLLCTTIYYSYGGALFGHLNGYQDLMVVACVWGVNLVFSTIYLKFFDVGPVEALWRSMAERTRIPLRNPVASLR